MKFDLKQQIIKLRTPIIFIALIMSGYNIIKPLEGSLQLLLIAFLVGAAILVADEPKPKVITKDNPFNWVEVIE